MGSWVKTTTMPTYFLLLLSFTLTHGPCPLTHDCIAQENCTHFQEDVAKLESLSIESLEYELLVKELRKGVCNKEEKGFCCSTIAENAVAARPANKCCPQCRSHPRRKRCVSRRPGRRCCPCSRGCKK